MSYTIGRLPYEPIILVTYDPQFFDFRNDPYEVVDRLAGIAIDTPERLCIIHDLHGFDGTFSDAVAGLASAFQARPASDKVNDSDILFIGGPNVLKLVDGEARQAQNGSYEIAYFETIESALQSARS